MADIYSHMPPTGPVFSSKSMPSNSPLGPQPSPHHLHSPTHALTHSSIHSQFPNLPPSSTAPQRSSLKRARSDDEDDAMDGSPTLADKRVLTSAKGRKLASIKRPRVETINGESLGRTRSKGVEEKREEGTAEDEVDAGVLLGMSIPRFPLVLSLLIGSGLACHISSRPPCILSPPSSTSSSRSNASNQAHPTFPHTPAHCRNDTGCHPRCSQEVTRSRSVQCHILNIIPFYPSHTGHTNRCL